MNNPDIDEFPVSARELNHDFLRQLAAQPRKTGNLARTAQVFAIAFVNQEKNQ